MIAALPETNTPRERIYAATGLAAERILNSNLEPEAFREALQLLGEGVGVDRVCVHQFHHGQSADTVFCSPVYEWINHGMAPSIRKGFNLSETGCRRWYDELSAGHPISGDLASFAQNDPSLAANTIKISRTLMPVFTHGKIWGFIGFDIRANAHDWSHESRASLRFAAKIFGSAFEKRDYLENNDRLLAEYKLLLNTVSEVIFRIGPEGRITFISPACQMLTGRTAESLTGARMHDVLHIDTLTRWHELSRALIDHTKTEDQCELRFHHTDGSTRWALVRVKALPATCKPSAGFAGSMVDITTIKETEITLIQARSIADAASQAQSEFLATMNHELRTPLNAIIGLSDALIEGGGTVDTERTQRYLTLINQSGRHLLSQVNDILELTRIDSGKSPPVPAPVYIDAAIRESMEGIETFARSRNVTLVSPEPTALSILVDRHQFALILRNLLDNAVKFTPSGGRVYVESAPHGDQVAISIRDTGVGIAPEHIHRLFKPFSQIDASHSRKFGGTGLGLVLVDRLARLNKGSIAIDSTPSLGSTFTLFFPVTAS